MLAQKERVLLSGVPRHFSWKRKFPFQGEAKKPKIMGCCRAIFFFAFIHGLKISTFGGKWTLRCPETLFISHEHANFLFSVFRVVQGEAKTPKIMGCCRANFAFLHALKFGTFRGKWTLEWVFKTSHFFCLALYFFNQQENFFFFACLLTMPSGNCQKRFDSERRTVQKITFCLCVWKPL